MCGKPAADAHHLIERRLWDDGGYYIDNGVSVCPDCHILAEQTSLSVEQLREAAGIAKVIIPSTFVNGEPIDKWGNYILPNGNRMRGPLFFDESVQASLRGGNALSLFVPYVKYPRTFHLPWSMGLSKDDKRIKDLSAFVGQRVIVTEKLDGENTSIYSDGYIHARSIDGRNHQSRNWVKNWAAGVAHQLPDGWRICGENLYATHAIHYEELPSYFMGFSIWNGNVALSWDDTLTYFLVLGVTPVNVLYDGIYDENVIRGLWSDDMAENHEGYVMRVAGEIEYSKFSMKAAKFVRKNHVASAVHHWMAKEIVPNKLKE